jgi:hypothetical protein
MPTAQIVLTEEETTALRLIAQQTGKTEDELIHEAVGRFLDESRQPPRRTLLQQARGMWQDRTDLAALATVRAELDRR